MTTGRGVHNDDTKQMVSVSSSVPGPDVGKRRVWSSVTKLNVSSAVVCAVVAIYPLRSSDELSL